jgi:arylsulfatase A-like enzyme
VPRGVLLDCPVQNVDIVPTVLDLVGEIPPDGLRGASLVSHFGGDCRPRSVFSEERGISIRRGTWKLWQGDDGVWRLFDLVSDPGEHADRAAIEADTLAALHVALENWRSTLAPPPEPATPVIAPALDSAAVEKLQALGYVQ